MTHHVSGAVRDADARQGAGPWVPFDADLAELSAAAHGCAGCELAGSGTRTVFGRGRPTARVLVVGDQPGDAAEASGRPFVGRAARLLGRAFTDAGFSPTDLYVTTAVKHFRFRAAGTHRIPLPPEPVHVMACRPWLGAELTRIDPLLIVALGSTAAHALAGPSFRMSRDRGVLMPWPSTSAPGLLPNVRSRPGAHLLATVHPGAVLASTDVGAAYAELVEDLRIGAETLS